MTTVLFKHNNQAPHSTSLHQPILRRNRYIFCSNGDNVHSCPFVDISCRRAGSIWQFKHGDKCLIRIGVSSNDININRKLICSYCDRWIWRLARLFAEFLHSSHRRPSGVSFHGKRSASFSRTGSLRESMPALQRICILLWLRYRYCQCTKLYNQAVGNLGLT